MKLLPYFPSGQSFEIHGSKLKPHPFRNLGQAVKLSKEIGGAKAAAELGIPVDRYTAGQERYVRGGWTWVAVGIRRRVR